MPYILYILISLLLFSATGYSQGPYVKNKGIPGNNVCNLQKRLNRAVLKRNPSLVIIMIGTNDMVNPRKMLSYPEYACQLNLLITRIKASGADVLLLSLPAVDTEYLFTRHNRHKYTVPPNERIDTANSIILNTAREQHCMYLDINGVFKGYNSPNRTASSLIRNEENSNATDGVHPTSGGYKVIAESIFNFLKNEAKQYRRIICFGDSITFGAYSAGQGTNRGKTYPAVLKKLLTAR